MSTMRVGVAMALVLCFELEISDVLSTLFKIDTHSSKLIFTTTEFEASQPVKLAKIGEFSNKLSENTEINRFLSHFSTS